VATKTRSAIGTLAVVGTLVAGAMYMGIPEISSYDDRRPSRKVTLEYTSVFPRKIRVDFNFGHGLGYDDPEKQRSHWIMTDEVFVGETVFLRVRATLDGPHKCAIIVGGREVAQQENYGNRCAVEHVIADVD
jgi:hypothetical protein